MNFAQELHYSFLDSNINYLKSYVDWKSLENSVVHNDPFRKKVYDTLMTRYSLADDFVNLTHSGADVRFITYYQEEDKHVVVFRVFEQPQSLSIYEFHLVGNAEELYVEDIYDYSSASSIRTSLSDEVDFWCKWGDEWSKEYEKFENLVASFNDYLSKGDLKSAYLLTKQLPDDYLELKRFRQLQGVICENSGSPKLMIGYLSEEVNRIPIMEKGRWLPLFYLRSIQGSYGEALIALSNLEKEVGEDVYIDFLKGNVYFEMEDYESAIAYFNKSLSTDSEVMIFHLAKIHSYINKQAYTEAVEALLVMDDSFKISEFDWDAEFAQYPEFISSSQYKEFLNRLD